MQNKDYYLPGLKNKQRSLILFLQNAVNNTRLAYLYPTVLVVMKPLILVCREAVIAQNVQEHPSSQGSNSCLNVYRPISTRDENYEFGLD